MKVEEFVTELKANIDKKEEVCRKHVKKVYVSFLDKVLDCQRIINATMEIPDKNDETKRIFRQNTPARALQFNMVMLMHYTDLEIDEGALIAQYDMLDEVGALEPLNAVLPQNEINEFTTLLSMTADDYVANHRSLVSYIDMWMNMPVKVDKE